LIFRDPNIIIRLNNLSIGQLLGSPTEDACASQDFFVPVGILLARKAVPISFEKERSLLREKLSSTLEDYLETICRLQDQKGFARDRDIAEALDVASSTATAALHALDQKGMINYKPYEPVTLSSAGREESEQILLRHRILRDFLENVLAIPGKRADGIACKMEHAIDREALLRFVCFLVFIKDHSGGKTDWLAQFGRFLSDGADGFTCKECVEAYMDRMRAEPEKAWEAGG